MKCWSQIGQCTTVCANPISVMGSVMGQLPLRNGILLVVHCYKNCSPLQLVGTKHHGFATLVGPKSKHFGFQYEFMGEGYDVLKVHNRCKEFEHPTV